MYVFPSEIETSRVKQTLSVFNGSKRLFDITLEITKFGDEVLIEPDYRCYMQSSTFIEKWLDFGLSEMVKENGNTHRTPRLTTKENPEFLKRIGQHLRYYYQFDWILLEEKVP